MKKLIFLSGLFLALQSQAQYYYSDVVVQAQTSGNFSRLMAQKVKKVVAESIEPDGSITEDFLIEQSVNGNQRHLLTRMKSPFSGTHVISTFFNNGMQPQAIIDSSGPTVNKVDYNYDANGRLSQVNTRSWDPEDTNKVTLTERRIYEYNKSGHLQRMFSVKDGSDTTVVVFQLLKSGQPEIEYWFKKGRKTETWYYYYDDKNRLSDIVRFNEPNQKMIPDYLFEYTEDGLLEKQTIVQPGTNFYRVWYYQYMENGLKKAESVLNKGIEQEGRIIYTYSN